MAFFPNNGIFSARPALGLGGLDNVEPIHAGLPWQWNGGMPSTGMVGLPPTQSNAMWAQPSLVGAPVNQPQAFASSPFALGGGRMGQFANAQQPNRLAGLGRLGMLQRTMVR